MNIPKAQFPEIRPIPCLDLGEFTCVDCDLQSTVNCWIEFRYFNSNEPSESTGHSGEIEKIDEAQNWALVSTDTDQATLMALKLLHRTNVPLHIETLTEMVRDALIGVKITVPVLYQQIKFCPWVDVDILGKGVCSAKGRLPSEGSIRDFLTAETPKTYSSDGMSVIAAMINNLPRATLTASDEKDLAQDIESGNYIKIR